VERRSEQSLDSLLWNVKRTDKKGGDMKKIFKTFSIMLVIEIVLIAILDAMA
jgi:hypothetical protein